MVLYVYMCCVCVFSLHRESLNMMLGDKPLIYDVVLSRSPLVDVVMPPRCAALPFHGAKLSSLHLLHLLTMYHLIAPPPPSRAKTKTLNLYHHFRPRLP
jgi:hypothetical protein